MILRYDIARLFHWLDRVLRLLNIRLETILIIRSYYKSLWVLYKLSSRRLSRLVRTYKAEDGGFVFGARKWLITSLRTSKGDCPSTRKQRAHGSLHLSLDHLSLAGHVLVVSPYTSSRVRRARYVSPRRAAPRRCVYASSAPVYAARHERARCVMPKRPTGMSDGNLRAGNIEGRLSRGI